MGKKGPLSLQESSRLEKLFLFISKLDFFDLFYCSFGFVC